MTKKIGIGLVVIFLLIQLIPKNLPAVSESNPGDFFAHNQTDPEIEELIKTSCYDCHSNETVYPWYSYVMPVSFLVGRDTRKGRKHLNFSNWTSKEKADMAEDFLDIAEEIEEGGMPMPIYLVMHGDAKLSDEQRQQIIAWAEGAADALYE